MSTMFWIWMAAAVVFLILELATPAMLFICFSVGAAVAGVYGQFYPESYPMQIGLFIVITGVTLPMARKFASKVTKESPEISNVDRMIGQIALVTIGINPDKPGQVKYQGEIWRAMAAAPIEANTKVTIVSISGTTVTVARAENN